MNTWKRRVVKLVAIAGVLVTSVLVVLNWQQCAFNVMCFFKKPYDKDFYAKNYQIEDGKIYRVSPKTGKRFRIKRFFSDNFENATSIRDLIGLERGWTGFTLQSPKSPTIADYNKLRNRILNGETSFLDNRVEPSSEQAHSGQQSLKTLAVAPVSGMICTKASLHTTLLYFAKGDDVWFSAWYYLEEAGEFITLMDMETTFTDKHAGMRIRLNHGYLDVELKWPPKPVYRQSKRSGRTPFPTRRWVHIKARLWLSEEKDGIIQLWQDGKLIIDQRGQTLPFAEAIYDDLEIGLSAHSVGPDSAVLYVDDAVISADPINDANGRDITIESNSTLD